MTDTFTSLTLRAAEMMQLSDGFRAGDHAGLRRVPTCCGAFALLDDDNAAIAVATTANLRRMIRSRLIPDESNSTISRRLGYAGLTRSIAFIRTGSAFESEWAWLSLARRFMSSSYRGMIDTWRAWFVHCNPESDYPRFVKTNAPGRSPTGRTGYYLGPIGDKHAAARYIEVLQDVFDLCRYHHILVQTPDATACAYKEMGRCPAPCDGTVSMDAYKNQIGDALDFARTPIDVWLAERTSAMERDAKELDFEAAGSLRKLIATADDAKRPALRHVDELSRFEFLAVAPSEHVDTVRIFTICPACIVPIADVTADVNDQKLSDIFQCARNLIDNAMHTTDCFDTICIENIGFACRHLFRKDSAHFVRLNALDSTSALRKAIQSCSRKQRAPTDDASDIVLDRVDVSAQFEPEGPSGIADCST